MRPIEIALTASLIPYVAYLLSPWRPEGAWLWLLPLISFLLMASHFFFEGPRWQMGPLYILTLLIIVHQSIQLYSPLRVSYFVGLAALLCVVSAMVLSTIAPVFQLPLPTGPYRIGTNVRHLVDTSRRDPQADIPEAARELMIQIWYPTDRSAPGRFAPYREKQLTNFRNRRLSLVKTHALLDVPLAQAQARYPVLIFSPSWRGQRTENTFHAEELASHGYIVVGIDHTYSTSATAFPDGRIARSKLTVDEDYSSEEAFALFVETAEQQVVVRTQDARFVLDALERFDAIDPQQLLTGRLDLNRVGIVGFSFGGTVAAEACQLDRRFRAGVDMDGMLAGVSLKHGTSVPFLFMMARDPINVESMPANVLPAARREIEFEWKQYQQMRSSLSKFGGYWIILPGTSHANFSDSPFFSPIRLRSLAGSVDPERTARLITRYSLAFFEQQLKGIEQSLLDSASPDWSEVRSQSWKTKARGMQDPRGE
jgi:dienelactone hydrolase